MLFNSLAFLVFLPLVFIGYWSLTSKLKLQNLFIVAISYLFYGWWDWRFLLLIAFTSLCSWGSGIAMDKIRAKQIDTDIINKLCKRIAIGNIFLNLLILCIFKYYHFFVQNFVDASNLFGFSLQPSTLKLILPVGISFYTFQALSYSIDVYRKTIKQIGRASCRERV